MEGSEILNSRVRFVRKSLNLSQETFGHRLGVTGAGISKIESGQRKLTDQMLLMICKEFNINERWLRYGEGELYSQKLPNGLEEVAKCYQLDELDKRILYEYLQLNEKKRSVIKEYIMRIAYGSNSAMVMTDGDQNHEVLKIAEGIVNSETST